MSTIYLLAKEGHDYDGSSFEPLGAYKNLEDAQQAVKVLEAEETSRFDAAKIVSKAIDAFSKKYPTPAPPSHDSIPRKQAQKAAYEQALVKWRAEREQRNVDLKNFVRQRLVKSEVDQQVIDLFDNKGFISNVHFVFEIYPVELS